MSDDTKYVIGAGVGILLYRLLQKSTLGNPSSPKTVKRLEESEDKGNRQKTIKKVMDETLQDFGLPSKAEKHTLPSNTWNRIVKKAHDQLKGKERMKITEPDFSRALFHRGFVKGAIQK